MNVVEFIPTRGMMDAADLLWRINNEYRKRLGKVERYVELLEQLLLARAHLPVEYFEMLEALKAVQQELAALEADHRDWRYSYYYDSSSSKRMVHDDNDVNRALAHFSRMRSGHERRLHEVYDKLATLPRPDPSLTTLPNGDLWNMLGYAFDELAAFVVSPDSTLNS